MLYLGFPDVYCIESFSSFDEIKADVIVLFDFFGESTDVYEILLSRRLVLNKSESFGFIKEFDNSFIHCIKID